MRKPTAREKLLLERCIDGLRQDVDALGSKAPLGNILHTSFTNVAVVAKVITRLYREDEPSEYKENLSK